MGLSTLILDSTEIEIQISFVTAKRDRTLTMLVANDNFRIAILRTTRNVFIHCGHSEPETTAVDTWVHQDGKLLGRDIVDIERESREKKLERQSRRPLGATVSFSRREREREKEEKKKEHKPGEKRRGRKRKSGDGWQSSLTFVRY